MLHKMMCCTCAKKWQDVAPLALRLALGAVFAYHGYVKLFVMGVDGTAGFLESLGFPLATLFAIALIIVELVGGIFMMLGFLTHWTAKLFIIVSVVAFLTVHATKGFAISNGGYEFIMTLFAVSLSVMITGAGKYSIDNKLVKSCSVDHTTPNNMNMPSQGGMHTQM